MKEIARVEILDESCDDCRFELAGCDRRYPNKIECNMLNDRKNWKVEQFPETFEELKELCKDLKIKVENLIVEFLPPKTHYDCEVIWFGQYGLWVDSNGFVLFKKYIDEDMIGGAKHRTPAQMWAIIKNLIGEQNGNKNKI